MFLVGLTGGIASGKSTVARILKEDLGCVVIDADVVAREGKQTQSTFFGCEQKPKVAFVGYVHIHVCQKLIL